MTDQLHPEELGPDDLAAIAADDALLDAVAAGKDTGSDLGVLLTSWRRELDTAVAAAPAPAPLADVAPRAARWHRHVAGGVAAVVVLAASTGVAAAVTGPQGPLGGLNRFLASTGTHRPDPTTTRVDAILDQVRRQIAVHREGISEALRAQLNRHLDRADVLIATADDPMPGLAARSAQVRDDLAAVPGLPAPPADDSAPGVEDRHGSGGEPSDDAGHDDSTSGPDGSHGSGDDHGQGSGEDHSGRTPGGSGDDGSGHGGSGGDGSPHDDGGPDDGTSGQGSDGQGSDGQGSDGQGSDGQDSGGPGAGDEIGGNSGSGSQDGDSGDEAAGTGGPDDESSGGSGSDRDTGSDGDMGNLP